MNDVLGNAYADELEARAKMIRNGVIVDWRDAQSAVVKRLLENASAREARLRETLGSLVNTCEWQIERMDRWGKIHCELDVMLEEAKAVLNEGMK